MVVNCWWWIVDGELLVVDMLMLVSVVGKRTIGGLVTSLLLKVCW